jgi:hypothetical protein
VSEFPMDDMDAINAEVGRLKAQRDELLAALKDLLALWEEAIGYEEAYMDMADFARKAIAKAEGRAE